jgi:apolipoprotein N-acyltransferase
MATALIMPPWNLFPLAIPGFSVLYLLLSACETRMRAFQLGWWWGFGFFTLGLYWICISLYVEPEKFAWLTPFVLFGFPAILAFYTGLFGALWRRMALLPPVANAPETLRLFLFALCWVGMEWLRACLFTGFPWNLAGYGWTFSVAALQLASLTGIYGLSFLMVLIGAGPALLVLRAPEARRVCLLLLCAVMLLPAYGLWRLAHYPTRLTPYLLRLVQADIPQRLKWDAQAALEGLKLHARLSEAPGIGRVSLVIWPETAVPFYLEPGSALSRELGSLLPSRAYLITGALRRDGSSGNPGGKRGATPVRRLWNSLFALDAKGTLVATYDKHHLVPFGEYMPLRAWWPVETILGDVIDLSRGKGAATLAIDPYPAFSPLICYEAIFPDEAVDAAGKRARWLLNISDDAWFGDSAGPYQYMQIARLRAIEQGAPLVRVSNSGLSSVFDPLGRELARLPMGKVGVLDQFLPEALPDSAIPDSKYYHLIQFMLICGSILFIIVPKRDKNRRRKDSNKPF